MLMVPACLAQAPMKGCRAWGSSAAMGCRSVLHSHTAFVVLTSVCLWLQDYRVHIKHTDGHFEHVPYFSLPANDLTDVIAPSCYSCFDYPNALADLVSLCFATPDM